MKLHWCLQVGLVLYKHHTLLISSVHHFTSSCSCTYAPARNKVSIRAQLPAFCYIYTDSAIKGITAKHNTITLIKFDATGTGNQCYIMPTASSITPLHSLGLHDQNELQFYSFGHVTPLGPTAASCDTTSVVNGIISFLTSRYWNEVHYDFLVIWCHWNLHQCHMVPTSSMASLPSIWLDNWTKVQHDIFNHVMPLMMASVVMWCQWCHWCPHCILQSRQLKSGATSIVLVIYIIGTGVGVTSFKKGCQ